MVVFLLCVKAELENVEEIIPEEHMRFCLDLKQSDGDEERKGVYVSDEEEHELQGGSKDIAHFVFSWPDVKRQAHITVKQIQKARDNVTRAITADDSGKFVPIAAFDCKGCEPIAWYPDKGFTCTVRTPGAKFEDVDLGEGEWTEYDEKAGESVSVMDLKHEFRVHREK